MARTWVKLKPEDAMQHPLYGLSGWLGFLGLGTCLGIAWEFVSLAVQAVDRGTSIGAMVFSGTPVGLFSLVSLAYSCTWSLVFFILYFQKNASFRQVNSALWLGSFPLQLIAASVLSLLSLPNAAVVLTSGFVVWALSGSIWVTYLQRSQRVRVTFEHCVLAAGADYGTSSNTTAAATGNVAYAAAFAEIEEVARVAWRKKEEEARVARRKEHEDYLLNSNDSKKILVFFDKELETIEQIRKRRSPFLPAFLFFLAMILIIPMIQMELTLPKQWESAAYRTLVALFSVSVIYGLVRKIYRAQSVKGCFAALAQYEIHITSMSGLGHKHAETLLARLKALSTNAS